MVNEPTWQAEDGNRQGMSPQPPASNVFPRYFKNNLQVRQTSIDREVCSLPADDIYCL